MELESLVMAELESMDLNGVRIINLSCRDEATDISFEIGDMKIDFTATNEHNFQVIALTHGDTVYTDAATLSKCNDWVKYVITVAKPIIEKHRAEIERKQAEIEQRQAEIEQQQAEQITIPSTVSFNELKSPIEEEEHVVVSNVSNERIDEVVDRGRKEGYKAARKKNIQEIKKLKRKHRLLTFIIIIILAGAAVVLLYLYQSNDITLPYLPDIL